MFRAYSFMFTTVVAVVLIVSPLAQAEKVAASGSWLLDVTGNQCSAQTHTSHLNGTYFLSVTMDKRGNLPMQAFIYPKKQPTKHAGFYASIDGSTYMFGKLPTSGSKTTFWGFPLNTDKLVSYFKRESKFRAVEVKSGKKLSFSLRGSTQMINKMIDLCGANSILTGAEFESLFLNDRNTNVNLDRVSANDAVALRNILAQGVADYRQWDIVQGELEALEAHYANLNSELSQLTSSIRHLEGEKIPYLKSEKVNSEEAIAKAERERIEYMDLIGQEKPKLENAHRHLDTALANRAPYVGEHNRLLSNVNRASNKLANVNSQISHTNSLLNSAEDGLQQLHYDVRRLEDEIVDLRRDRRIARSQLVDVETEIHNFDIERRVQRLARDNTQLADIRNQLQDVNSRLQSQNQAVKNAQGSLNQAEQALKQCRGNREPIDFFANQVDENRRKKLPGKKKNNKDKAKGGQGGQGGGKCTDQVAAVQAAKDHLNHVKTQRANIQSRKQNLENKRQKIRSQIRQRVQVRYDAMLERANDFRDRVDHLGRRIQRKDDAIQDILHGQIPSVEREVRQLGLELNQLQQQQSDVQYELDGQRRTYENYKLSVNYDYLEGEVQRTQAVVNSIEATIASHESQVDTRERTIRNQTKYKSSLVQQIADSQVQLASNRARKAIVAERLVPYGEEKSVIVNKLNGKKAVLDRTSNEYTRVIQGN